ncbi:DUF4430 domain-containing protein [Paenibacillus sp. MER 180]|uniref:DUF4430 domain-containing protein n=1 Tax=Paenibacillus sp. MER 180 TaxID=2939570 RepID=UPI002041406D|nr:DUF4430 domain-containing protein [Paenibacillus sp. MER 180]MCM3288848.1 DUF4430 domain-containing protein [Paenibacillus sp. MER 180]
MITNRMLKKSLSALLSIVLLLSLVQPQVIRAASGQGNTQLNNMIEHTVQYYKDYYKDASNQDAVSDSWWELVALWSAGQDLHDGTWRLPTWETKEPRLRPNAGGTDHIRYIYGLLALGKNPAHAWETNRNLWAELAAQQDPATGAIGGVNKHIWAMLALSAGEKLGQDMGSWNAASKQKALDYLLKAQYADGGYGLSATGSSGDTDITGMALLALGQYQGQSAVDAAIERAKELLKKRQLDNGGFDSVGTWGSGDNSNSLSTSVSGLVAAGDDVLSAKWKEPNGTVIDAYARFQQNDGSFKWKLTDSSANRMATEQALVALLDIKHGKSVWSRLAEVKLPSDQSHVNVQVSVKGIDDFIYQPNQISLDANNKKLTALDALKLALDQANPSIPYLTLGNGDQARLTSVAGQNEGKLGGSDGWKYKVNGSAPSVGAGAYEIKNGDDLYFYYGRQPMISTVSSIQQGAVNPTVEVQLAGDSFTPQASQIDSWLVKPGTTELKLKTISLLNSQKAKLVFEGRAVTGGLTVQALGAAVTGQEESNGLAVSLELPKSIGTATLSVEIRSVGQGDILAPVTIPLYEGDTAFTALKRELDDRNIDFDYSGSGKSVYIKGIDPLWEFDKGPLSGWMYSVNGAFPNYSAGIYTLKGGDVLRWQYTTDMGKDIGSVPDPNPSGDKTIVVGENETNVSVGSEQEPLSENKVTLVFSKDELPHVASVTSSTYLEIEPNTFVISSWDRKLELPRILSGSDDILLSGLNGGLSTYNKEATGIDSRVKVGGDQDIHVDKHATLTLKGQGNKEAALMEANGTIVIIPKYTDESVRHDEFYSYANSVGDLVIKTKQFGEFLAYIAKIKDTPGGDNGNGGGVVDPLVTGAVTISVEKRSIGEGEIISPISVPLFKDDTAFTVLKRLLDVTGVPLQYVGSGESLYVQSIADLGEFDKGPNSGWMYSVNQKFYAHSADKHKLVDGDVLQWSYTCNLGLDIGALPTGDSHIKLDEHTKEVLLGTEQEMLSSQKLSLEFRAAELPKILANHTIANLNIDSGTEVTSPWNNELEMPRSLETNESALLAKINAELSLKNKETSQIDSRVKVGGDQHIQFSQHVTLTFKGQANQEAGFVNASGAFAPIPKYNDSSARKDEVYSYVQDGHLIVKTTHFTEFVTYRSKVKDDAGNGGVVVPPATNTITLSVEKRTVGKGDIIAPVRVELQDGDTAYTALERIAEKRGISIESTGSGANLYIQAIDGLAEFDNGSLSGWMYSVNGKFPNYSAGIYNLKNGDVLRWQYTTNLGEDVGNKFEGNKETPGKPGLPVHPGGAGTGGGALTPKQVEESAKLKSLIDGASAWILSNRKFTVQDNFNDWDVMALARSGKQVPSTYYAILENYVKEKKGEFRLVTDYERMALAVTAIGKDPSNIAGFNLLEKIYNNGRMTNQGTNGLVFALLALDANKTVVPNDALWTRDKLIQQLLAQQNSDGGFPLSKESNAVSDIDMTAMSLQALAKYQDRKEIKAATDKALSWLSSQQLANGGFKAWGVETSESISQVIIALSGLGIDLEDKRFVKKDGDLLKALRTYFNTDGGFAHSRGEASNYMATQQALLALTAYDRVLTNRTSLYVMTDAASTGTQKPKDEKITYTDDASISAWAKEAVHKATELGFMQGTGKDKDASQFEPKRELSRAEFAALIVKYAGLQPQGTDSGFTDVSASSWYAGYVATAKEKGLISGVSANKFAPNQAISRQEMAAMLVRMKGLPKDADSSAGPKDQQQVAEWALPYVKYAYQAGLMSGEDGYFKPQLHVTREMAAVVMVRLHGIQ